MKKNYLLLVLSALAGLTITGCGNSGSISSSQSAVSPSATEISESSSSSSQINSSSSSTVSESSSTVSESSTDSSSSEAPAGPTYVSLVNYDYSQAASSFDMHDLYVNLNQKVNYLGYSITDYYNLVYDGYEYKNAFISGETDYYQLLKTAIGDNDYVQVTPEIRDILCAISKINFGYGYYYYYYCFVTEDFVNGTEAASKYVPLCSSNGYTKKLSNADAAAYFSIYDNLEYKFANGNVCFAGVDMATYYSWYPSYFQSAAGNNYDTLVGLIGDTADENGYALVTADMMKVLNAMGVQMWNGDNYYQYFCYVKDGDTYREFDYTTDGDVTEYYVNPTVKMVSLAYGTTNYSIYDYYTYFNVTGEDYYAGLTAYLDTLTPVDGCYYVVDATIEDYLDKISNTYFGYTGYGYEFEFVLSSDLAAE